MTTSIGGSTGITFPDASVQNTAATGFGFKNRIINGAMVIDQRNAGAAKTLTAGTVVYVLDRFYAQTDGGAGVVQQVAGTGEFTKAMRVTGASGVTGGYFGQKIESYNIADCASSTVTYKLRASSSVLTTLTWYARFPTAQDNYTGVTLITSGSITITSTPTNYTFQIALPAGVTNGFEVYFTFGAFTSGTLDITGVQLEKGSTATSFDYRPYGTELMLCQRYYQEINFITSYAIAGFSGSNSTLAYGPQINYPVTMRSAPTITPPTAGQTSGTASFTTPNGNYPTSTGTFSIPTTTISGFVLNGAGYTGLSLGTSFIYMNGSVKITASAEL
jgi:hypothetical protein